MILAGEFAGEFFHIIITEKLLLRRFTVTNPARWQKEFEDKSRSVRVCRSTRRIAKKVGAWWGLAVGQDPEWACPSLFEPV